MAITYQKGVIICEPYERMTGAYFSIFIDRNFNTMFQTADKGLIAFRVQNGDPSRKTQRLQKVQCRRLIITITKP